LMCNHRIKSNRVLEGKLGNVLKWDVKQHERLK